MKVDDINFIYEGGGRCDDYDRNRLALIKNS